MKLIHIYKRYFFYILLVAICLFGTYLEILKIFSWDELEHIHSSFLIYKGQVPFTDFFQHHPPIFWYLYSPLFYIIENTWYRLLAIKVISIGIGFINLFLLYKISQKYLPGTWALVPIPLVFSTVVFLHNGMEIRPDNLMLTCLLISIIKFELFLRNQRMRDILLAGLLLGISFVILPKTLLYIPIFIVSIIVIGIQQKKSFTSISKATFLFTITTLFPIVLFVVALIPFKILPYYYFFNWTLNLAFQDVFSVTKTFFELFPLYRIFFLLAIVALMYVCTRYKYATNKSSYILLVILAVFTVCILPFSFRSPYTQYFLPFVYISSIPLSIALRDLYVLYRHNITKILSFILFCLLISPLFFYEKDYIKDFNFFLQAKQVLDEQEASKPEYRHLKVQDNYNLFTTSHSFYWFSEHAQKTIKRLDEEKRVPSSIPRP